MKPASRLLKSLLIYLTAFLLVILFVLLPRTEHFSWTVYGNNIRDFVAQLLLERSLGVSQYNVPAGQEVLDALGKSILIIPSALLIAFVFGILKGMLDYVLSKWKLSVLGSGVTWLFQSIPDFLLLLLAQWYIIHHGNKIRFFAPDGWTGFYIPVVLASIYPVMYVARITYASIASQEGEFYIKTAVAKGLPSWLIFFKHIMLNCVTRILTHFTPLGVYIISSLVLIEYFRNILGAARRMFVGIDYMTFLGISGPRYEPGVLIGIAFCFMLIVALFQIISFLALRWLGPAEARREES
ncbi:hypothetical protein AWM70_00435 [Paenibacillus yonginensis]|uniref:ABC transmembrane type-1 domain-containing protein n=1 Tax=Paenibacillus yonginensis TaxID=1462996 RepID=A0A1B1MVP5_9BACL|nr:ABC transporter permease subunit [Paenibacillus yonginensis]ANS73239.1 hypothetical protein AWM70_00435 [Paenibacillus yonginensis]